MGVKELWTVLSPVSEKKSLWELKNKRIAVDLSAWICDSQNVGDYSQRNMYLRNLFFRTSFLLLLGAKPLFVLEGAAPELKHKTIISRAEARNGKKEVVKSSSRSYLKSIQSQCEAFLKTLGVPCIKGSGEAEAYCAWLNSNNIVDAVITQDSDSLLYGAKTVYRNFTMSPSYTCEAHEISVVERKLNLGRKKLLALSLLCGCDYDKGVNGVGKESAVKFLSSLDEHEVLDRLRSWRNDPKYKLMESKGSRQLTLEQKIELSIRKKALQTPDFPSEDIIKEYLCNESSEIAPEIQWLQPDLPKFLKIAEKKLNWEEQYAIRKFFPLMTRWHLLHPDVESCVHCECIIKKRIDRGINSYECRWSAPAFMLDESDIVLSTIEPQDLIHKVYSDIAEEYVNSKTKKSKKENKTTRKKKVDKKNIVKGATNVEELLHNLSIEEAIAKSEKKPPNKKRLKDKVQNNIASEGLQTLDKYFKPEATETTIAKQLSDLHRLFIGSTEKIDSLMHSTPKRVISVSADNCHNISCHYDKSVSPSPLKHKNCTVNRNTEETNDKNVSKCSVNISERWSLNNYLIPKENDNEIEGKVLKRHSVSESMTASFLNTSNVDDDDDFNISNIINCIVDNKENAVFNQAVKILLK